MKYIITFILLFHLHRIDWFHQTGFFVCFFVSNQVLLEQRPLRAVCRKLSLRVAENIPTVTAEY